MKLGALEALACYWWSEIDAAKHGNNEPLIEALLSEKPIPPREERWLRNTIAALLSGKYRRKRGAPAQPEPWRGWRLAQRDPDLFCAVVYVERYKEIQARRRRHRPRWGVEAEAIAKAAQKYGVPEQRIHNYLHRSTRARRAKNKRT